MARQAELTFIFCAPLLVARVCALHIQTGMTSAVDHNVFNDTNAMQFVRSCEAKTKDERDKLVAEIQKYEKSTKFFEKIREAKGEIGATAGHKGIVTYLREKILQPGWSVLELGCAAGGMLRFVQDYYHTQSFPHGSLVGVELVTGWVNFAQTYYKDIKIYEGDITEFAIPEPYKGTTFDMVMLNDVMEHIEKKRYGCLFSQLDKVTHPGSIVYMHTPSPMTQIADRGQYFENVVPHHFVVMGMAMSGFELVQFEHDVDTVCDGGHKDLPRLLNSAKCYYNGWPKYTHQVYRKVHDSAVLNVSSSETS